MTLGDVVVYGLIAAVGLVLCLGAAGLLLAIRALVRRGRNCGEPASAARDGHRCTRRSGQEPPHRTCSCGELWAEWPRR